MKTLQFLIPCLLLGALIDAAENLNQANNGGFERGTEDWAYLVISPQASGEVDTAVKHSGNASFRLRNLLAAETDLLDVRDISSDEPAWAVEFRRVRYGERTPMPTINPGTQEKRVSFPLQCGPRKPWTCSPERTWISGISSSRPWSHVCCKPRRDGSDGARLNPPAHYRRQDTAWPAEAHPCLSRELRRGRCDAAPKYSVISLWTSMIQ